MIKSCGMNSVGIPGMYWGCDHTPHVTVKMQMASFSFTSGTFIPKKKQKSDFFNLLFWFFSWFLCSGPAVPLQFNRHGGPVQRLQGGPGGQRARSGCGAVQSGAGVCGHRRHAEQLPVLLQGSVFCQMICSLLWYRWFLCMFKVETTNWWWYHTDNTAHCEDRHREGSRSLLEVCSLSPAAAPQLTDLCGCCFLFHHSPTSYFKLIHSQKMTKKTVVWFCCSVC